VSAVVFIVVGVALVGVMVALLWRIRVGLVVVVKAIVIIIIAAAPLGRLGAKRFGGVRCSLRVSHKHRRTMVSMTARATRS
jgi:hypothetical protein